MIPGEVNLLRSHISDAKPSTFLLHFLQGTGNEVPEGTRTTNSSFEKVTTQAKFVVTPY
jgi:hypothetical protein